MLSLTTVLTSEVIIEDVADKFELPCQRVHTVTVTVCRRPDKDSKFVNNVRNWVTILHRTELF